MYSVTVKIEGIENKRRSAGLLHIVVGFYLVAKSADYYRLLHYQNFLPTLPFFAVAALSLFYGFFRRRFDRFAKYNTWLRFLQVASFIILGLATMERGGRTMDYAGLFVFALLCFLLVFSEIRVFQETAIFINETGITIPGTYRNYLIKWEDLAQVVVREDFLTIFHIKKKYLQYQVMQDLSTLEVAKMNAFCREQIEKKSSMANRE